MAPNMGLESHPDVPTAQPQPPSPEQGEDKARQGRPPRLCAGLEWRGASGGHRSRPHELRRRAGACASDSGGTDVGWDGHG